jgi:putative endonuclease
LALSAIRYSPLTPAKAGVQGGDMAFYVYILASKRNGTIYVGMTDDLVKRIWQHRNDIIPGFTTQHGVKTLVWYEAHESREAAFERERQIRNGIELGSSSCLNKPIRHGAIVTKRFVSSPGFPLSRE